VTQAVARAALAHRDEPLATVQAIRAERDDLVTWLRGRGLAVADSDANFALFGEFADRHAVWQALLDRGVLIRETGPPGWLRVTVGRPEEMTAFRDALDAVLNEGPGAVLDKAPDAVLDEARGAGIGGAQRPAGEGAPVSEPKGRGGAWTEERGTSDEGRRRLQAPRRRAGEHTK
jgi:hypothetical protein